MVVDTTYYDRLKIDSTATPAQVRKAYRELALKVHPDKNPGDEEAHKQFQEIGEAYQVLSDPELRKRYNEFGLDKAAPSAGFEDPSELFNMIFGGNAFVEWVGELALMKGITDMLAVSAKQEAEAEAAAAAAAGDAEQGKDKTDKPTEGASPDAGLNARMASATVEDEKPTSTPAPAAPAAAPAATPPTYGIPTRLALENRAANGPGPTTKSEPHPSTLTEAELKIRKQKERERVAELLKQQDDELKALEEQRRKVREERIASLTKKLIDRLSIWTEGDFDDPAAFAFREKFRIEAESLKLESFGLNILHVIGETYCRKAKNFLGMSRFGWLSGKWSGVKDVWNIVSTTLDVQRSMSNMARLDEEGGPTWTDERKAEMEAEVTGKVLSAAWLGSRHEIQSVLREVCNNILEDETVPEHKRALRAQAMLMIGEVFLAVERDPEDGEALAFEQLVAESAAKKQEKKEKRKSKWNLFKSASPAELTAESSTKSGRRAEDLKGSV